MGVTGADTTTLCGGEAITELLCAGGALFCCGPQSTELGTPPGGSPLRFCVPDCVLWCAGGCCDCTGGGGLVCGISGKGCADGCGVVGCCPSGGGADVPLRS